MSPIWMVPVLALTLGGLAVAVAARQAADSARELAREIDRLGEIAVAAANLWDEAGTLARARPGPQRR